ncbi:MAG TPA: SDR family oxidoreductase [Ferruginibacter sp.]|nr:SDR family oxidoreductase [Ferruginibacter sp.]
MKTKEKYVLITGGTSGIGLELAKIFANNGHNLIIVARDKEELAQSCALLKASSSIKVISITKDLFEEDAAMELYDLVKAQGLEVEILVNNAGQGQYGLFIENDLDRELDIIQLNICSVVVLTKLYLKEMVERGSGRILNVTSIAGKIPGPWQAVYHGTKAFAHSFTEAIREEVRDTGVTITSLLPGATDTDFFNKADMLEAKNVVEGKLADPAKVAEDGYKALMSGDDMIISGFQNKVQIAMSNITPDSLVAKQVGRQQEPAGSESKK